MKVPRGALLLRDHDQVAVAFSEGEDKKLKLNMTIYSGGIIRNHYYWDDLVLDLDGAIFDRKKYPILHNHWTDEKIAFTEKPIVDGSLRVDPEKTTFVSTPESEKFQTLSKEGFPYEASARVVPTVIERIKPGAFAEANGIKVKGPGTIFRKWRFLEGSVCVFGYDRNTKSTAFSEEAEIEIECQLSGDEIQTNQIPEGKEKMKKDELIAKYPDQIKEIQDDAVAEAKASFSSEKGALETKITALEEQNTALGEKVSDLEKKDLIRTQKEIDSNASLAASKIWDAELSESSIPEKFHSKARERVKASKFMKDDLLDKEAFTQAVKDEIISWGDFAEPSVQGQSFTGRENALSQRDVEAEDAQVNEMLEMVGDTDAVAE